MAFTLLLAAARRLVEGDRYARSAEFTRYDPGYMQVGDTQQHTFVVRNIGNAPLQLTPGQPSCKCTVSEFSTEPVPPGESREVLLTWKPMMKCRQRRARRCPNSSCRDSYSPLTA